MLNASFGYISHVIFVETVIIDCFWYIDYFLVCNILQFLLVCESFLSSLDVTRSEMIQRFDSS